MLIFRKEHNERHLHTVRGNIFKKNQRRGVFYRGPHRISYHFQKTDQRPAEQRV